ncbi:hypothetical protein [Hespellia stercorisuis]|uniref:RloB-like protein n=1 Tax=Hespellia stercorisuis DSM 15480 TaxID=1121950 RepID=A0A1M6WRF8_9FIRM|nr:hypothetical protein [Hespellia stercorisuis]SHK96327.1 hypothetical protein SAMN02745243_04080 [Hespellia stercorisuis DSM 15480]
MNKCLVLFVEGDTEVEFYKQVVANARKINPMGRFDTNIEYRNVKGVGGFKNIALRKFVKEIKPKYLDDCEFTIVLCSDTDVFEFASKPPIKWNDVKNELENNGASKIIHVQAKRSIEDWFLNDIEGILKFLRLNKKTKVSGKNGYDKLQRLYKQANKVYFKGIQSDGMIARLNIEKIAGAVKDQLNPLYKALGSDKN